MQGAKKRGEAFKNQMKGLLDTLKSDGLLREIDASDNAAAQSQAAELVKGLIDGPGASAAADVPTGEAPASGAAPESGEAPASGEVLASSETPASDGAPANKVLSAPFLPHRAHHGGLPPCSLRTNGRSVHMSGLCIEAALAWPLLLAYQLAPP